MLAAIDTAYTDTRADALSFALGLPPLDALAVLRPRSRSGASPVEFRLLGASHQVIVAGGLSETVACLPGHAGPLPRDVRRAVDGWSYAFTAEVRAHDAGGFQPAVDRILARLRDHPHALVGTFPGSEYAVTALVLEPLGGAASEGRGVERPGGLAWRTWHAYPQTREIVMTSSRMRRRAATGRGMGEEQ